MRIDFKLFDLAVDKIKEPIAYYMDLQPDWFTFWLECTYDHVPIIDGKTSDDEEEDLEVIEDEYMLEVKTMPRQEIIAVNINEVFRWDTQVYTVDIIMKNGDDLIVNFQTKKEAMKFHKTMVKYSFEKNADKLIHDNI